MLGYIPDRAYYFTVNKTIDLGILAWSPDQLLSAREQRVAAVPGAGRRASCRGTRRRAEIALPAAADRRRGRPGRDDAPVHRRIGRHEGAGDTTSSRRPSGTGNFDKWADGPALPAAAVRRRRRRSSAGKIYVDRRLRRRRQADHDDLRPHARRRRPASSASGRRPPAGRLVLPEARSGAGGVRGADGLLLIGGANAARAGRRRS